MLVAVLALLLIQDPAPRPVSLDSAIRRGIAARGQVGEARAGVAEALAGRRLAGQVPNPIVSYSHTGDVPHQHAGFDQQLSWLTTRASDRAGAAAVIRRARADSALLVAGVAEEVRAAFFGALGARESERLVQEQVAAADSLARLGQRRFDAGDISRFEYEQAAQEARRGRQLLSFAREATRGAIADLARAMAWTDPAPPTPAGALDQGLEETFERSVVLDSMPMIASAVADSTALAFELRSANRARLPIPSVSGGAEWDDPGRPGQGFSVIGLAVPLPLWNTGGAQAALARARADRGAALATEARLEAARAITQARARLEESARRARFARDSLVPAARALRDRALAAYRGGETSVLSVLDAMRSEREVVLGQIQDFIAFQAALAAWYALFGRTE